ncbi:hypothetical protein LZ31DRAFT_558844 [Colletotrichum somersetense]|nr:hypothetical protein LZ31DRAFT_558844 [Colletotrichum somersetense]
MKGAAEPLQEVDRLAEVKGEEVSDNPGDNGDDDNNEPTQRIEEPTRRVLFTSDPFTTPSRTLLLSQRQRLAAATALLPPHSEVNIHFTASFRFEGVDVPQIEPFQTVWMSVERELGGTRIGFKWDTEVAKSSNERIQRRLSNRYQPEKS